MAQAATRQDGWLFGPLPDLLLGCGGLYLGVLLAFSVAGPTLRVGQAEWLGPLLVLFVGAPHYGATLLRVYEERSERRAYAIFAVWVTLAICAALVASLFSAVVATALVTLYLTWSPWHYTGQNYGLAVMFLRRRGVPLPALAKRLLYGSFLLSFATTVLVFHGAGSAPAPEFATGPREMFTAIGIPASFTAIAFPACFAGYLACLAGASVLLLRGGTPLRAFGPAAAIVLLQALWFSVPFAVRHWNVPVGGFEPLRWSLRDYYFFWIALGHSAQYLWITSYYARQSEGWRGWRGESRYLARILVAGTAVWTLPALLFDPARAGVLPNSAALSLLVAAAVNVHHFVLDGAIWKLRDGRIANVLIRRAPVDAATVDAPAPTSGWARRGVWTLAAVGCALALFRYAHESVLFPRAMDRHDFAAARSAVDRLAWISYIGEDVRGRIDAVEVAYQKRLDASRRRAERSAGVIPDARPWLRKAQAHANRGEWQAALHDYERGLALDPTHPALLRGAGHAWLALGDADRARQLLERNAELHPWDREGLRELERARRGGAEATPPP